MENETKINVLNSNGEVIQTVYLHDYLNSRDFSDKEFVAALLLSGERIYHRSDNPSFDHSAVLA